MYQYCPSSGQMLFCGFVCGFVCFCFCFRIYSVVGGKAKAVTSLNQQLERVCAHPLLSPIGVHAFYSAPYSISIVISFT